MFTCERSQHCAHSFSGGFCAYHKCCPPVVSPSSQVGVGVREHTNISLSTCLPCSTTQLCPHSYYIISNWIMVCTNGFLRKEFLIKQQNSKLVCLQWQKVHLNLLLPSPLHKPHERSQNRADPWHPEESRGWGSKEGHIHYLIMHIPWFPWPTIKSCSAFLSVETHVGSWAVDSGEWHGGGRGGGVHVCVHVCVA